MKWSDEFLFALLLWDFAQRQGKFTKLLLSSIAVIKVLDGIELFVIGLPHLISGVHP
jgi:hypothetical protein